MARSVKKKLIQMVDEGALDPETILRECLRNMSESDVADMAADNEWLLEEDVYGIDEEEEEDLSEDEGEY